MLEENIKNVILKMMRDDGVPDAVIASVLVNDFNMTQDQAIKAVAEAKAEFARLGWL